MKKKRESIIGWINEKIQELKFISVTETKHIERLFPNNCLLTKNVIQHLFWIINYILSKKL